MLTDASQMDFHLARALLAWQLELGADEPVGDHPVNRYELPVEAPKPAALAQTTPAAAPVIGSDSVDAVTAARAAAQVGDLDALTQKAQQFIATKPTVTAMTQGTHPFPLKKMLDDTLDAYEAMARSD